MKKKKVTPMKPYALFSYAAGCSAVFFTVLLMILAVTLSPRPQGSASQRTVAYDEPVYQGDPNSVEQYVQIIEPQTVPQEVYIER
ncbi:hypothetical protein HY622_01400 [Candidatus Uhrbacteria bacterium]|nr:hypothetical protein [Candidatus Uhrbacteria bacterium]